MVTIANLLSARAPAVFVIGIAGPTEIPAAVDTAAQEGCVTAWAPEALGEVFLPTFVDADEDDFEALVARGYVPTSPQLTSQSAGMLRPARMGGSTLAQAALTALPGPVPGAHSLLSPVTPEIAARRVAAGGAVLVQARGRRVAVTIELPKGLQSTSAPSRIDTAAPDPLRAELAAILDEERMRPPGGRDKRIVRRWSAALEGWRRRGVLAGATAAEAFRIQVVAPGEFEVALRYPARRPTRFVLRSHQGR